MTSLRRCWDSSEPHLKEAIASRTTMAELLREMAAIAKPDTGAPKILIALARLAKPTCDWIEGALRIEIEGIDTKTRVTIIEDLGGGVSELLFPRLRLDAPLEEFRRSLKLAPQAIAPLEVKKGTGDKLVLTNDKRAKASEAPPSFELAEDCLRRSLPPAVRKSIAPGKPPPPPPTKPVVRKAPVPLPKAAEPAAPRRGRSTRPPIKAPDRGPMMMDIPRSPKVLDFGDMMPPPGTDPKKSPRR